MADDIDKELEASLGDDETGAAGGSADPLLDDDGGKKKKILILVAGLVVLLIGGGAAAYFTGMLGGKSADEQAEVQSASAASGTAGGVFLPIPDMIVNLNAGDATPRYLRLSVQLELKNELDKTRVEAVIPRVVDQFQTYLRELRVRDLRGSAGIYRLQMELLARVNEAAHPVVVQDVLFQEILVQ